MYFFIVIFRLARLSGDLSDLASKHAEVSCVISGVGEAWVKLKQQISDIAKSVEDLKAPLAACEDYTGANDLILERRESALQVGKTFS